MLCPIVEAFREKEEDMLTTILTMSSTLDKLKKNQTATQYPILHSHVNYKNLRHDSTRSREKGQLMSKKQLQNILESLSMMKKTK